MKSAQRALVTLLVFVGICVGLLIWSVQYNKAKAAKVEAKILSKLSAEDINTILQGNPQLLVSLKDDAEARKDILKNLEEILAQAAAARRAGLADEPETKHELEFQEKLIVAQVYNQYQAKGQPAPPLAFVSPEEVKEYLARPESGSEFKKVIDAQMKAIKATGRPVPKLEGAMLEQAKDQFARLMVAYEKAKADAQFMAEKGNEVKLQVKLQEAVALSRQYAEKNLVKKAEPTKQEIAAYIAAHPEYDVKKQREKAESVLQRIKNGEDFGALAKEFSEDPGSKEKGGLYEGVGQGQFMPEFEKAALAVEPGQVVPNLVETTYGYHIIKLEDKKVENKDGKTGMTYNVRHILVSSKFPAPGASPMGRPQMLSGEEIAKAKLSEEKREKILKDLVKANHIELPEDFTVVVPEGAETGQVPLPEAPPQRGAETEKPAPKAPAKKEK